MLRTFTVSPGPTGQDSMVEKTLENVKSHSPSSDAEIGQTAHYYSHSYPIITARNTRKFVNFICNAEVKLNQTAGNASGL